MALIRCPLGKSVENGGTMQAINNELEGQAAADSGKKTNSLDRGGSSPNMKEGTATKTRSSVLKDKVMGSKENAQHCLAGSARTLKELEGQAAADSGKKTNSLDRGGSSPNMKEGTATKTRSSVLKDKNSEFGEKEFKEIFGDDAPKQTYDQPGAVTPATVLIDEEFRALPDSVQPPEVIVQEEDYYHGFMPREDANSLLVLDGDFLLRTTEIACGDNRNLCLSLRWKGAPHHVIVHKNKTTLQYGLDPNLTFPTIADMIDFYTKKYFAIGSMRILLKNPILTQELEGQAAADSGKKTNSLDRGGSSPNMKEGTATKTRSSVLKDKNSEFGEKEFKEIFGDDAPKQTYDQPGAVTPATVLIDEEFRALPDSVQPPEVIVQEEDYYHGFMPREDANSLLVLDGDFLLRTTEIACGDNRNLCLSLRWKGAPHHVIVHKNKTTLQYGLDPNLTFPTIADMIDFYTKKYFAIGSMRILLKNPILTQIWELKHSQVRLLKKLGEGAFGEVHYGRFALTPRFVVNVAVKLLKCGVMNKKKVDEMMTEVRMMRGMRHPHIVRFYGVANRQEPLMIVMELIKEGALDKYLASKASEIKVDARLSMACDAALGLQYVHGLGIMHREEGALDKYLASKASEIKVDARLSMACDAALGLQYVHGLGIMHRDIAARNCLYDGEGVKLSDFGMSKKGTKHILDATEKAPIRWLAPEVFRTHIYTAYADIWAYGVLVWEIFNNAIEPYKGWNAAQVKTEVLKGYRLKMPDWAPSKVKEICARAWNDQMYARPTLDEIANELLVETGRRKPDALPKLVNFTSEDYSTSSAPSRLYRRSSRSRPSWKGHKRSSRVSIPSGVGGLACKSSSTLLVGASDLEVDTAICESNSGSREGKSLERFRPSRRRKR
ncbi:putative tyrosine-protein kinase kin-31 [Toxocara canis]|uniref:Tyrosine-protein kinase n=1 Tax=Toxocara canis TaxID=6265 RepID=A0A0B2VS08_TOXCA|nr:putative tyrosine-protein kinase kin-31 [Toxocara canis]